MSKLEDINYQPLSAMKSTAGQAFRQSLHSWAVAPLIVVFLCIVAGVIHPALFVVLLYPIFIAFIVFIFIYSKFARQDQETVWEQFAAANGWEIDTTTPPRDFLPTSVNAGHSQQFSSIIAAQIDAVTAYVFSYQTTIGEGKNSETFRYTLAVAGVAKPLPHMLLINKKGARLITTDDAREKLKLEGDFNDFFTLQIDTGQEVDVLTILTPDVMQALLDHSRRESIEITDRNVCFILGSDSRSPQDVQDLFETVASVYPQIAENVSHDSTFTV